MKVLQHSFRQIIFAAACLTLLNLALCLQPGGVSAFSAFAQAVQPVTVTNAAYYQQLNITANSLATAFGSFTTINGQGYSAASLPLPKTLGGLSATVNGVAVDLLYAGPLQINFVVPAGIGNGTATMVVTSSDSTTKSGTFTVLSAAPGIFTSNFTGSGAAAGEYTVDGVNINLTGKQDGTPNDIVLETGANARPTYAILYGTGFRNAPSSTPNDDNGVAEGIKVTVQGVPATVAYAGAQGRGVPGTFTGLDQINFIIPNELAGLGVVDVKVSIVDPNSSNPPVANIVKLKLAGSLPAIRTTDIAPGQTLSGTLSNDDQIDRDATNGSLYFTDYYRFTATAGMSVEIDLRSSQFDAVVFLRRIENNQIGTYLGGDDSGGVFTINDPHDNALLLTRIPENGEYIIYVSSFNQLETGAYTLKLTTGNITQTSYNSTVSGSITTSDLKSESGIYLDAYSLNITHGDRVQITMRSSTFNSFLQLRKMNGSDSGDIIAEDEDSGGGNDAQITVLPDDPNISTGLYVIVATPLQANVTGNYTLTVTKLASFSAETQTLELQPIKIPLRPDAKSQLTRRKPVVNFSLRRPVERQD